MSAIYVPTDWGAVEQDVIARLRAVLTPSQTRTVKSMISEKAADEFAKGLNSVFTHSLGTTTRRTGKGGNGRILLEEDWSLDILIYGASGKVQDSDRWSILTLAAQVKGIANGYSPSGQVDASGFLELTRDASVEDYSGKASSGLKIRQSYVLRSTLWAQVLGAAAA